MTKKLPPALLILLFLSACLQQTIPPTPTLSVEQVISTAIVLTSAALTASAPLPPTETPAPPPTETPLPTPTSSEPTLTPTPEPGFTKYAELRFVSPGPMSSLVSPIELKLLLTAGKSNRVRVDLLGEDGRLLYSETLRVDSDYPGSYRELTVPFEIRAVSEAGFLRLSTRDENKNLTALNVMPALLYATGTPQLTLPGNLIYERIAYEGLKNKSKVYGGEIQVKGLYWPCNEQPAFLDLVIGGKIVSSRLIPLAGIEPQTFETTLPYQVTEPTVARIAIHQEDPRLPIDDPLLKNHIYYSSIEVLLNP